MTDFKNSFIPLIFGLILMICLPLSAQFNGPNSDPIMIGEEQSFSATYSTSGQYLWTFESTPIDFELNEVPEVVEMVDPFYSTFITPTFTTTLTENGEWYTFVSNYGNFITRIDHGNSPLISPEQSTEIIGYFGNEGRLEGLEILKDKDGIWYGFVVNLQTLYRFNFVNNELGNDIDNVVNMYLPDYLSWPHQLNIQWFEEAQKFIGFTANRNSNYGLIRLDFGDDLGSAPSLTQLGTPSGTEGHCNFALVKENEQWHMFLTNLTSHNISRYDFGSDIENNEPEKHLLGNLNNSFQLPRGILMFPNCNNDQLLGYVVNENGNLIKLDFDNDITSLPEATQIGNIGNKRNAMSTLLYEGKIHVVLPSTLNYVHRAEFFEIPEPHNIHYYDVNTTYAYMSPGTYEMSLYTSPGGMMGISSGCKTINVVDRGVGLADEKMEEQFKLFPNPFNDEIYIKNLDVHTRLEVFDSYGRLIYNNDKGGSFIIYTQNWEAGIYFYTFTTASGDSYTRKMIKH